MIMIIFLNAHIICMIKLLVYHVSFMLQIRYYIMHIGHILTCNGPVTISSVTAKALFAVEIAWGLYLMIRFTFSCD